MIKKIFLTLVILLAVLSLALVIFLLTFDLNHYRTFVEKLASNTLGKTVKIKSLSTKLSLIPTINVDGVEILDPAQPEPLLNVPHLEAIVELTPLVHGQITVQKIVVSDAAFTWNQDNVKNTTKNEKKEEKPDQNQTTENTPAKKEAKKVDTGDSKLWIELVSINNVNCKIGKEKPYEFAISDFSLKELSKFSFDVVYDKKKINISSNFGSILDLFSKKNLPVDLTLKQGKNVLKINGKIDDLPNLKKMHFQINANIANLSDFLKSWKIQHKKIPTLATTLKTSVSGDLEKMDLTNAVLTIGKEDFKVNLKGALKQLTKNFETDLTATVVLKESSLSQLWEIEPFELNSKIIAQKTKVTFSDIQLNANKSDGKGVISIDWGKQPLFIQSNLESTYFDIADILKPSKKAADDQPKASDKKKNFVLSTEKLPFDMLSKIDADITMNIAHLKFSNEISDYASLKGSVQIKKGELKSPFQVGLLGGTTKGEFKVNSNKKNLNLSLDSSGLQLDKIKALAKDIQGTTANINLNLKGKGNSLHDIAGSASGQLVVELTSGQIINKWFNTLPTTLNVIKGRNNSISFSTSDQKTDLLCGAANITIKDGIATSKDKIALETDTLNFIVSGEINLKKETLDLSMLPSVSQTRGMANGLLSVAQSIKLTGGWKSIETKTDVGGIASNLLKAAEKKLTGEKSASTAAMSLCKNVLGRPLTQTKTTPKSTESAAKTEQKAVPATQKKQPNLKQQLIQSLSQALTDQIAPTKKQ